MLWLHFCHRNGYTALAKALCVVVRDLFAISKCFAANRVANVAGHARRMTSHVRLLASGALEAALVVGVAHALDDVPLGILHKRASNPRRTRWP